MYDFWSFISVSLFALVHLCSDRIRAEEVRAHLQLKKPGLPSRFEPRLTLEHHQFLSFGGGVAIAYIFIDLLPKLSKSDNLLRQTLSSFLPDLERHAYVLALAGFLLFFIVDRAQYFMRAPGAYFSLSLASYAFFNFLMGSAVADKANLEVQPLLLFTIAMVLHYFMVDYSLKESHGELYRCYGRWILIGALYAGWLVGIWIALPAVVIALVSAFIGGGVMMNVTRHELAKENAANISTLLIAAMLYTVILLAIG